MFQRLVSIGIRPEMLEIQYRMHADISAWPAEHFYSLDGIRLRTGASVVSREDLAAPSLLGPARFIDVHGCEQRSGHSWCNEAEATCMVAQARHLNSLHPDLSIGMIAPYVAQVQSLEKLLANANLSWVRVSSVDSFQGDECDVILFSAVRSNKKHNLGFVGDPQRLNVAITRAKRFLWIFGNKETLMGGEHWASLLSFYETKGWIVEADALGANKGKGKGKSNSSGKGINDCRNKGDGSRKHEAKERGDTALLELMRRGDWAAASSTAAAFSSKSAAWVARSALIDALGFQPTHAHIQRCVFASALADLEKTLPADPTLKDTLEAWQALQTYRHSGHLDPLRVMSKHSSVFAARAAAVTILACRDTPAAALAVMREVAQDAVETIRIVDALGWQGTRVWQFSHGDFSLQANAAVQRMLAYAWLSVAEALVDSDLPGRAEATAAAAHLHSWLEPHDFDRLSMATESCVVACLEAGCEDVEGVLDARKKLPPCKDAVLRASAQALLGHEVPTLDIPVRGPLRWRLGWQLQIQPLLTEPLQSCASALAWRCTMVARHRWKRWAGSAHMRS
eukprot:TRINITY_DN106117_c0_g1_i1.p1 TRINITY_DN106117_c0_g1~~TRINITY_DN106117_c0_g1_i1.p1  ORF type:complete len:568 (-),score=97.82 TRINITY_DN106117_c0_g1_i1:979-2682(-)